MPGRSLLFIKVIIKCIYCYNTYYNSEKEFFVLGQKETKWGKVEMVAVLGILASCAIQHVLPVPS
jgi:hypothetical protein